jgi:DNA-binding CsgD family transcriptional regulator
MNESRAPVGSGATVSRVDAPEGRVQLIGREAELADIGWLLSLAGDGGAGLSVVAAPGMGKTALLEAAAARARGIGLRVLRCAGVEAETGRAFAALSDLLEPILAEFGEQLPEPQRRALDVVALRAEPGGDAVEPHAVARATLSALAAAGRAAPVLIVVDDGHWLDDASRRALAFAVRRAQAHRLAVLVARRPGTDSIRGGDDEMSGALRALGDRHRVVQLAALTAGQIEQLLVAQGTPLPRAALRRIQHLAGGNPLYAVELARARARRPDAPEVLPTSLTALLQARIAALPAEAITVLGAAAQLPSPTRALVRCAVGDEPELGGGRLDAALDAAVDAGILVDAGGALRFAHPLLAEAAAATATVGFRRRVHRRLAEAVADVEMRAVHLSMAHDEPDAAVAAAIEAGGTRARSRAAPEVAAELLAAALRLTPADDSAGRRRRRVAGAYHWVAVGDIGKGSALLADALEEEPPGEGRVDLEWRCAMLHFLAGDIATCIRLLASAREHTGDEGLRTDLGIRLASMYCWCGRFAEVIAVAECTDLAAASDIPRLNALGNLAVARFLTGRPPGVDSGALIRQFESLDPPPPAHEHPVSRLAPIMLSTEPPEAVASEIARAFETAVAEEDDIGMAWNGGALARALLHAGRWHEAEAIAGESLNAARRAASPPALVLAVAAAGLVAAVRGDPAADALAGELIALGTPQPYLMCVESGRLLRGFLALSRGDASTAVAEMTAADASLRAAGAVEPSMPPPRWFLVVELLDADRIDEAEAEIADLQRFAAERDHALGAAMAWTARARVAALRGDRDAGDAAFAHALAAHDRLGWPFERAVTVFEQGRAHRQQRRRALAREMLTDAAQEFGRLGATLWERRARAELAAVSGRAPAAPQALTDAERRVAGYAAAGLTNQEIAERLFVSTKTVATHLGHVYAKLQLRSRTELARHLAAPGDERRDG